MKKKINELNKVIIVCAVMIIVFLSLLLIIKYYDDEEKPIGVMREDGWGANRLYCDLYTPTGWVYTFTFEIPQDELDKICEMDFKAKLKRRKNANN